MKVTCQVRVMDICETLGETYPYAFPFLNTLPIFQNSLYQRGMSVSIESRAIQPPLVNPVSFRKEGGLVALLRFLFSLRDLERH